MSHSLELTDAELDIAKAALILFIANMNDDLLANFNSYGFNIDLGSGNLESLEQKIDKLKYPNLYHEDADDNFDLLKL